MASDFNNQWVDIFRAGDYGDKGVWPESRIDAVVENFDPATFEPPAVLGHPALDSPAMGQVSALRRSGRTLQARFKNVHPALESLVREGRYPNRSAAFYVDPRGSGPVLRHVGFLGAVPPEVKGLAPVQFASRGEFVELRLEESNMTTKAWPACVDPQSVGLHERIVTVMNESNGQLGYCAAMRKVQRDRFEVQQYAEAARQGFLDQESVHLHNAAVVLMNEGSGMLDYPQALRTAINFRESMSELARGKK